MTILQHGERMLTHFEPGLVYWLMQAFEATGIDVRTQTTVEAVEKTGSDYRVRAFSKGVSRSPSTRTWWCRRRDARKVAQDMMRKYGPPQEVTQQRMIWHNNGP